MFYNILDKKRIDILPLLKNFKKDFYLGGGTALALQIGHRDSIDFDFFSNKNIDTKKLFADMKEIFEEHKLIKTQEDKNTLSVVLDNDIRLSFFTYKYKLLDETTDEENLRLASVKDIGLMKFSAITGRASNKDYIDLYYILQNIDLDNLLNDALEKFPDIDKNLILKSLVYFDDIEIEPIIFKNDNYIDFENIKKFLETEIKKL